MNTTPTPRPDAPTPITDDTFDAYRRRACGLAYVEHKMAELERDLAAMKSAFEAAEMICRLAQERAERAEVKCEEWKECATQLAYALAPFQDSDVLKDHAPNEKVSSVCAVGDLRQSRMTLTHFYKLRQALDASKEEKP